MWVKDSVRKFCLCVKAPLCKDSLCKSFCVFSLLGICLFSHGFFRHGHFGHSADPRDIGCFDRGRSKLCGLIPQHGREQGPPVWEWELFGFRVLHWMDLICTSVHHCYILLENLRISGTVMINFWLLSLETARQRPHLSSSCIILHHRIFFSILFWSTPSCFSFGPHCRLACDHMKAPAVKR